MLKYLIATITLLLVLACSGGGGNTNKGGGSDGPPPPPPPTVNKMGYFRPMKEAAKINPGLAADDSNNKRVNMHIARRYHSTYLMPNGKVMIAGGFSDDPGYETDAHVRRLEIFDPEEERFIDTGVDMSPRVYPGIISISESEVALIGGYLNVPVEIYNVETNSITRTFNLVNFINGNYELPGPELYTIKHCWKYPNSNIIIAITHSGNIFELDLDKETWVLRAQINKGLFGLARVNDNYYFFGGLSRGDADPTQSGDKTIIKYDINTKQLTTLNLQLPTKRFGLSAVKILDGRIALYGGSYFPNTNLDAPVTLTSVEVFDPKDESIVTVGNTLTSAQNDYAVQLQNGFTLHLGGFKDGSPTAQELFYDHQTNTSGITGNMSIKRADHSILMLPNGRVLVTGGFDMSGNYRATNLAEIYEPESKLYIVIPKDICVLGEQLQFSVQYVTPDVEWQIVSGAGLIDSNGLYSAPMEMPLSSEVVIKVTAKNDPTIFANIKITLVK